MYIICPFIELGVPSHIQMSSGDNKLYPSAVLRTYGFTEARMLDLHTVILASTNWFSRNVIAIVDPIWLLLPGDRAENSEAYAHLSLDIRALELYQQMRISIDEHSDQNSGMLWLPIQRLRIYRHDDYRIMKLLAREHRPRYVKSTWMLIEVVLVIPRNREPE